MVFGLSTRRNRRTADGPFGMDTTTTTRTRRRGFGWSNRNRRVGDGPFGMDTTTKSRRRGLFHRRNPERRAAGLKAALANPNTTHDGRKHAKNELHLMGRSAHVPLSTKIKRTLGIRSTPRRQRRNHVL